MPTISSSSVARRMRPARFRSGRWAFSTSSIWYPMVATGLSAFSALCMTTEISDQRIRCRSPSFRSSRSAVPAIASGPLCAFGREWNSTSPPVITPGSRSSRVAA